MKDVFSLVAEIIGRPELLKLAETSAEYRVCPANVQRTQAILLRSPTKNFVILLMEKKTRPEKSAFGLAGIRGAAGLCSLKK